MDSASAWWKFVEAKFKKHVEILHKPSKVC